MSRVLPPKSPSSNQETIVKKLKEAEVRKKTVDMEETKDLSQFGEGQHG